MYLRTELSDQRCADKIECENGLRVAAGFHVDAHEKAVGALHGDVVCAGVGVYDVKEITQLHATPRADGGPAAVADQSGDPAVRRDCAELRHGPHPFGADPVEYGKAPSGRIDDPDKFDVVKRMEPRPPGDL